MQLQTQVPHRDWSSAAATSILQSQLVPSMNEKKQKQKTCRQTWQTIAVNKTLIKRYEAALLINNISD